MTEDERTWQRDATVYQVYPRSFNDSDGDGVGDLRGVVEKVPYIDDLGVDVVWLNPVYDSPQVDNGYDIRDYRSIYPPYGTLSDWETLRDRLHERDVRLVMDLVVNHTSDEHDWFQASRRGDEPYADYYVWEPGDPDDPPNNWESLFGGSAWAYDDEREAWYLHLFDERMPDLDWRNPDVRGAVYEMMHWWFDRGIDGFRLDVINLLSKAEGLPDGDPTASPTGQQHFVNGPRIHEFVREMHDRVFSECDAITIGETIDVTPSDARQFVLEDGLDMVFPFDHMYIDQGEHGPWDVVGWDMEDFRAVTERWQTALDGGWIGLYLSNHDQPRAVSRFGDDETHRAESATMLATYLFTLRGTPFVYQGQEIAMTNPDFRRIEEYRDPATINRVQSALATGDIEEFEEVSAAVNYWSRDNARTPMQWSDAGNAGFTTGDPWIKVNDDYPHVNVAREASDERSVLSYYRRLIDLRDAEPVLVYGDYGPLLEEHRSVLAYRRTLEDEATVLVVLNFTGADATADLPAEESTDRFELLVSNYEATGDGELGTLELRPYEARVYRRS